MVLPDYVIKSYGYRIPWSLNAPTGAWCSLTAQAAPSWARRKGLNAPTGAWCSLTMDAISVTCLIIGLNAPTGAWCSLTWH